MRIVTIGVAAALAGLALGCGGKGGRKASAHLPGTPRHVILISIDTLRADRCGLYGYDKPTTPFLDEIAQQGVWFENHYANSNNTLISHASILTGLDANAHGTYDRGPEDRQKLTPGYQTLGESFAQEGGFTTAAFTTHPAWLGDTWGLEQGFDHLESDWIDAETNTRNFLRWLDRERPDRLFAFLHYYDPHSEASSRGILPYDSTEELIQEFAGPKPEEFRGYVPGHPDQTCSKFLGAVNQGKVSLSAEEVRWISGLYDAGVREMDDQLRDLFAKLKTRGILEDALIVITSDHGEELFDHGQMLHDGWHDEIQRVPLVIVPPTDVPLQLGSIDAVTRSIDVAPTILDLAGLSPIGQGRSLREALVERAPLPNGEVMFGVGIYRAEDEVSAFKYYGLSEEPFFYDLTSDPGETKNLCRDGAWVQQSAARLESLSDRIRSLQKRSRAYASRVRANDDGSVTQDAATQEALNQLGY